MEFMPLSQEYLGDDVAPLLSASCPECGPTLCLGSGDANVDTWLRWCVSEFTNVKLLSSPVSVNNNHLMGKYFEITPNILFPSHFCPLSLANIDDAGLQQPLP